jgi:hypothetical protein
MPTKEKSSDYRDAKDAFDSLELEDKAVFLMDAVFSTVLKGVEDVSSAVSDAMDDLVRRRDCDDDSDATSENGAKSSRKTTAKKTTTRKRTAAKKKTPKTVKRTPKKDADE